MKPLLNMKHARQAVERKKQKTGLFHEEVYKQARNNVPRLLGMLKLAISSLNLKMLHCARLKNVFGFFSSVVNRQNRSESSSNMKPEKKNC